MDGEQGEVVICVDADVQGDLFLCLFYACAPYEYSMRALLFVRWVPSVGAILWFLLARVLGIFFGRNCQRKSAEIYSYIVGSSQLRTMRSHAAGYMGPRRQKKIRGAGQSGSQQSLKNGLPVVTGVLIVTKPN